MAIYDIEAQHVTLVLPDMHPRQEVQLLNFSPRRPHYPTTRIDNISFGRTFFFINATVGRQKVVAGKITEKGWQMLKTIGNKLGRLDWFRFFLILAGFTFISMVSAAYGHAAAQKIKITPSVAQINHGNQRGENETFSLNADSAHQEYAFQAYLANSFPLTGVSIDATTVGSPSGTVSVSIYSDDGSNHVDALLGTSSSITADTLAGYTKFSFPTPVYIINERYYWIVVNCTYSASGTNYVTLGADTASNGIIGDGYDNLSAYYNGSTWTYNSPGTNGYFITWSGNANGTIYPSAAQTVALGKTTSFTLRPKSGNSIFTVAGSCGGSLNVS